MTVAPFVNVHRHAGQLVTVLPSSKTRIYLAGRSGPHLGEFQ